MFVSVYLPSVQSDGSESEGRDVKGTVLHESTDVTHAPSKNPGAIYKPHLHTEKREIYIW